MRTWVSSQKKPFLWESDANFSQPVLSTFRPFNGCLWPLIFHRQIYFYTAFFELFCGGHGHLATLMLSAQVSKFHHHCFIPFLHCSTKNISKTLCSKKISAKTKN
jgi:hypothetical protein